MVRFALQPNSGVPIFRQIIDQVLALVASGKLRAGDLLPSIRQAAADADVNPMTISKAYALLEQQGVVKRHRGIGMRVARRGPTESLARRKTKLRTLLAPIVHRGSQLGLSAADIRGIVDQLLAEVAVHD